MPNQNEPHLSSVIESAMSRLNDKAAPSEVSREPMQARSSLGRRDYDLLLAQRLEQLQNAMGESPFPASSSSAAATAPGARSFSPATLLATALLSALTGAGSMWLAVGGNPPGIEQQTSSISPAPAPIPTPIPVAETVPAAPSAPIRNDEDLARDRLEAWRLAWSSRDGDGYLSHYSPDFVPADGQSRAEWAAARRKNLASRPAISVEIHDLEIERIDDRQLKLAFRQDYAAGSYRETAQPKTLLLVRQGGEWLIAGEWQGGPKKAAAGK